MLIYCISPVGRVAIPVLEECCFLYYCTFFFFKAALRHLDFFKGGKLIPTSLLWKNLSCWDIVCHRSRQLSSSSARSCDWTVHQTQHPIGHPADQKKTFQQTPLIEVCRKTLPVLGSTAYWLLRKHPIFQTYMASFNNEILQHYLPTWCL